jgi:hypothetical protein
VLKHSFSAFKQQSGVPVIKQRSIAIASLFIGINLLIGAQALASQATEEDKASPIQPAARAAGMATGTILSTIDASGYTYVETDMGDEKIWLAGPQTKLAKGDSITVKIGSPMRDFHSKTLNRDFPIIYFIGSYSGSAPPKTTLPAGHQPINGSQTITAPKKITLNKPVKRAENGQTIAEIIANKKKLAGKKIKVRGQVTKFSPEIMTKNWLHLIDGSSDSDLIITTNDKTKVGQIIVIEGTVVLDKDFGYGYFYKLLIEDAKVTVEKE